MVHDIKEITVVFEHIFANEWQVTEVWRICSDPRARRAQPPTTQNAKFLSPRSRTKQSSFPALLTSVPKPAKLLPRETESLKNRQASAIRRPRFHCLTGSLALSSLLIFFLLHSITAIQRYFSFIQGFVWFFPLLCKQRVWHPTLKVEKVSINSLSSAPFYFK